MWRGARDVLLQINVGAAESRAGFLLRRVEQRRQFGGLVHDAHAASAAARRGFQDYRIADFPGQFHGFFRRSRMPGEPGQNRHARFAHERAGPLLHAHQPDHIRTRTDELQAGNFAHLREAGILAEETVARMDGVGRR